MEQEKSAILRHMARSHLELSRILHYKSEVCAHMSGLIGQIPDQHPTFEGIESLLSQSAGVTKSVTNYLASLAELEEALATNLQLAVKELSEEDENE
ncbi:hypothetical protein [Paenibacillus lutrae]|uniref:Nucleoside-diphosphate sugar epimerase n=1 Tax=Paenibacillus lutrae TaxID=2078573 RepID=A0A7X3FEC9_9BACL|nr:hypothetical protein [Paenibacillus lutrae]MVO97948.1 hypothetical protein [Paenibacillus lutrae]